MVIFITSWSEFLFARYARSSAGQIDSLDAWMHSISFSAASWFVYKMSTAHFSRDKEIRWRKIFAWGNVVVLLIWVVYVMGGVIDRIRKPIPVEGFLTLVGVTIGILGSFYVIYSLWRLKKIEETESIDYTNLVRELFSRHALFDLWFSIAVLLTAILFLSFPTVPYIYHTDPFLSIVGFFWLMVQLYKLLWRQEKNLH